MQTERCHGTFHDSIVCMPCQNKQHTGPSHRGALKASSFSACMLYTLYLPQTPKSNIIARNSLGNLIEYTTTNINCCILIKMSKDIITQQVLTHLYALLIINVVSIGSQSWHMCRFRQSDRSLVCAQKIKNKEVTQTLDFN